MAENPAYVIDNLYVPVSSYSLIGEIPSMTRLGEIEIHWPQDSAQCSRPVQMPVFFDSEYGSFIYPKRIRASADEDTINFGVFGDRAYETISCIENTVPITVPVVVPSNARS